MTEPRGLSYLVPVDVLAEVNTAVTVLGNLRSGVTEALRQLNRATTVAWKAVNLAEVTDDEWQLVKHVIAVACPIRGVRLFGPRNASHAVGAPS